ncbi:MAG TPA: hypothetical protein DCF44_05700 [Chitinophagaceae bacterium]|nr:hypothetical protein [Chitinophagaceae bacterium]
MSFFILYIALNKINLYGYHGVFPEEKIWGTWFELNIQFGIQRREVKTLNDTIDYARILEICKGIFQNPHPLSETLLFEMELALLNAFPDSKYLNISIRKKNPPLGGSIDSSMVRLEKKYD